MEHRRGRDRYVVIQIGHAIAVLVDNLPVSVNPQRAPRRVALVPLFEDLVHLRFDIRRQRLWLCLCGRSATEYEQKKYDKNETPHVGPPTKSRVKSSAAAYCVAGLG